jgi:hypothetical protein
MVLLCLLVPLCGCENENFQEENMETGVLRFVLSTDVPRDASTRSVDVNAIHDIHLLVYDASHKLLKKVYYPSPLASPVDLTLQVRVGSGYTVYGIANTGDEYLFSNVSVIDTEDKLKAFPTGTLLSWDAIGNGDYLLMSGSVPDVSVSSSSADPSSCNLSLKRLAAQVTLHVGIAAGSGVTISGYRIYGVPKKSYYLPHPLITEENSDGVDEQTTRAEDACLPANASDWTNSGTIPLSDVTAFNAVFYMYENRPGVNTSITLQKNKIKANVPASPIDSAAYVIIYGKAAGYSSLSWKVYLGANNTSNFNMKRNSKYAYTITLKPNDSDTRITYKKSETVWAGSNIYWDGSKLTFDTETTDANNKKQGVAFKWGSLIGVSLSSSYVTYTPTYNSGNPTTSSWTSATGTYSDFSSIAYISIAGSDYGQTNTFLNDAAQNTNANYAVYKGDICQYLSKTGAVSGSWRMPTAKEYNSEGLADNASVSWSTATTWASFGSFGDQTNNVNAQGTISIPTGGIYTVNGSSSSFSASGYSLTNGSLYNVGQSGRYWSSSAYSSTGGFSLGFDSSNVGPANGNGRQYGFVVRCVQN